MLLWPAAGYYGETIRMRKRSTTLIAAAHATQLYTASAEEVVMRPNVEAAARRKALEQIVLDLGRLQGLARTADETFVAFLIASVQREAGARCEEVMADCEPQREQQR